MNKALQRYLEAATGLTNLTKAKAEQIAQQLVRQGEFASDNVGEVVDELLERQRKNREMITGLVKSETKRMVRAMGLATTAEVERLQKQVSDLEREVTRAEAKATAAATTPRATAKKSTKKSTKKSAAKKPTKKSAAKKSAGKKSAEKKSTKKSAKKSTS